MGEPAPRHSEDQDYELIEEIGSGSFGEVWLARDLKRDERVALKFLRLDRTSPGFSEHIALFKREFELLSELRHAHLARVFDFGYSPSKEHYFFSSEYCPGKDLLEATKDKPVSYFEEILVQILSALDYIHSQGIIHFDIKPANVLVSEKEGRPVAKLVDFGVAGKLKALPQGAGGSPAYMAPELFIQEARVDHRADLYSFGILSLQILTGRLPFKSQEVKAVIDWHLRGSPPDSIWQGRWIPQYLRDIVEKLIAKKPSDRFSNSRAVLNFLNLATGRKYLSVEETLQSEIPVEGPLVERREGVLDLLQDRFQTLLFSPDPQPVSSVCYITGERGIGKSRILEELRRMIELKEVRSFKIDCDWQTPTWPRLAKSLELSSTVSDDLGEEWQNRRRSDSLVEAARNKPFCLLIDDFQKADRDLTGVLVELAKRTKRERAEGRPVPLFVAVATEEPAEDEIRLNRLSLPAMTQYIKMILGQNERVEMIANLLHQYSGGLPLLMVEGLRFLAPHLYRGEPLENLLPPPQIGLLYLDKIRALNPSEQEFLQIVALLFRPTTEGELLNTFECEPSEIDNLSRNAVRMGLMSGGLIGLRTLRGEGSDKLVYRISSQALALDLIQNLDPERRLKLHQKIARGLMKTPGIPSEEIAYHLSKGGEVEKGAEYYKEAGIRYKKQGQISSATGCLTKSIRLLPEGSLTWQELLLEISRLLVQTGAYREAEGYLQKMQDYPSSLREELAGWLAYKQRRFAPARTSYEKAIQMLPREDPRQRILLENALANIDLQEGKTQEAAARFRKTLSLEQNLSPEEQEKIFNNNLGLALILLGDADGALEFYQARRRRQKSAEQEMTLLNGMGYVCLQASRYQETISYLKKAMQIAEETGAMHTLFSIMGNLITALIKESRFAEGIPLLQKMVSYQQRLGTLRDVSYNLLRQGTVYLTLGIAEAARDCFEKGKKIAIEAKEETLAPWFLLMEGYWEREHGSFEKADDYFRQTELAAQGTSDLELVSWAVYARADLAYEEKKIAECRRLLAEIKGEPKDEEFKCRLELLRAKTTAAENKKEEPDTLFAPLEARCLKGSFREILWEVYYGWGEAKSARGDRDAARLLFEKGIRVIESIATPLPEEYRDRYLTQRSRGKLYDGWREIVSPSKKNLFARMKGFFS